MPLTPGSRLGPYEVVAQIGAGGMGIVYRARDTKLNRDVALKVLPESFVDDPARLARLRREAQVLASVNHEHIGGIHGIEDAGGTTALVLEFIDGPTLGERIADGPIPVDEALSIAKQICEALDAAHEQGIVHRDLKPANIKIKADGTVKVLDFGLAKAADAHVAASGPSSSHIPTVAAMTQAGMILGTAAYMSPEQARGQIVDRRTDIWAFGCVLFEMLSATPAFQGETMSDVVANVLRGTPDWNALPATAGRLGKVIQRCLDRDIRRRFRDIADVRMLLDDATEPVHVPMPTPGAVSSRAWRTTAAAVLGVIAGGAAVGFFTYSRTASIPAPVQRFELQLPEAVPLTADTYGANVAFAPDGSRLVYTSMRGGVPTLISRTFDQLEARPIAGSDNGFDPFFSPDSEQIGFSTFGELKRVAAAGGPVTTVCQIDAYYSGASWAPDGSIVFAQSALGLFRVPAAGGERTQLAVPDRGKGEQAYVRPLVLPGGRAVLFTVIFADNSTRVVARRLDTDETVTVLDGGFGARYLPSGHLLYGQRDRLMAVRFNVTTLRTAGAPVVVQEGVYTKVGLGVANVTITDAGAVGYVSGHASDESGRLVWLDRAGRRVASISEPVESPRGVRLSPDGRRVAVTIGPPGRGQIWIYDVAGGVQPLKLTFQDHNIFPVWSPDGKQVAFMERAGNGRRLLTLPSDGSVLTPEILIANDAIGPPVSWSPDSASLLLYGEQPSKTQVLRLADRHVTRWLDTPFSENGGRFSPEGRWVVYGSNQSGILDIWVRPFPGPGAPVRVSAGGGSKPLWSRDGKEIFFQNGPKMMASRVLSSSPEFRVEAPRLLFEGGFVRDDTDTLMTYLDVAQDGRFLAVEPAQSGATASVVVVQRWEQELDRLLPGK